MTQFRGRAFVLKPRDDRAAALQTVGEPILPGLFQPLIGRRTDSKQARHGQTVGLIVACIAAISFNDAHAGGRIFDALNRLRNASALVRVPDQGNEQRGAVGEM